VMYFGRLIYTESIPVEIASAAGARVAEVTASRRGAP
jgi:hypothetical protein